MKVVLDFGPIGSGAKFKLRRYAGLFLVCFIIAVASVWDLSFLWRVAKPDLLPWAIFAFVLAIGGTAGGFLTFVSFAEAFIKDAGNQGDYR